LSLLMHALELLRWAELPVNSVNGVGVSSPLSPMLWNFITDVTKLHLSETRYHTSLKSKEQQRLLEK
jgi:hypothetical protein